MYNTTYRIVSIIVEYINPIHFSDRMMKSQKTVHMQLMVPTFLEYIL